MNTIPTFDTTIKQPRSKSDNYLEQLFFGFRQGRPKALYRKGLFVFSASTGEPPELTVCLDYQK